MDKDKIIKALECYCESDSFDKPNCKDCPAECMSGYMSIPFIQQVLAMLKEQEAKTGRWIYKKYDDMFMCSCCEKYSIRNDYPYCHWCGAKMEGRERDA